MEVDSTIEELWHQEQANFSAHLAMMFGYLEGKGLPVEDFVRYAGERAISSWEGSEGVADLLEGILFNVRSNGNEVVESSIEGERARAVVTGILRYDAMEYYGVPRATADLFWDKFVPLAAALGVHFAWRRLDDGTYEIELARQPG